MSSRKPRIITCCSNFATCSRCVPTTSRLPSTRHISSTATRQNKPTSSSAESAEHTQGIGITGSERLFKDALREEAEEEQAALSSKKGDRAPTGADKLLQDALHLKKEEQNALSRASRTQDPNDPVWTGEERVQDTVLRMVMDKYKPLRISLGDASKNPADEKIRSGIQQPSAPGTLAGHGPSNLFVPPGTDGQHEDGRKLPKTPDEKPWRAVYVRPVGLGVGAGEDFQPSIYYGQFLKSSSGLTKGGSSEMRSKLKAAGVNVGALPLDDPKAMSQLRQGVKVAERRGKLLPARDNVLDYQISRLNPNFSSTSDNTESDVMRGDELSDTNRDLQYQLGHAQGWDSVIEKRIKAALDSGLFKENKLRGKPIKRDMEEKNPFLAREEYFMNRIVKRQGAAPPWVELNIELESELSHWRTRFTESWIRRASRMITTSSTLAQGLEPLPLTAKVGPNAVAGVQIRAEREEVDPKIDPTKTGAEAKLVLEVPAARTPGEQRLVEVATQYRDAGWEKREKAYHVHELKRLNDLIRKHNHLAPFTARKGLMVLDVELGHMYTRALPKLVYEISSLLHAKVNGGNAARKDGWDDNLEKNHGGLVTYDMWGREIRPSKEEGRETEKGMLDGWFGSAIGSSGNGKAAIHGGHGDNGGEKAGEDKVMNLRLIEAIQKSLRWARQQIRT
ncbi:uncharacterized protein MEPE_05688 [Melanopsichium pennsylvanicum]|uniref:DnaJ homologue subfamily C member 28 conserved domain-containing protein n=2 Tax=Melanopsichium pennsylvanicum TaxID=63383 RepID=A0AAJ4XPY6_9BASI|nr:conserved hypothetical protein [Melanopsichium pennsylvanicum 4]SNX86979.1 uncharacterized protein MEPE_05688 [Melanopsichium pennsylvanicum]